MKIAYYYPPQTIVEKDIFFCKYTGYEFLHHRCDDSVDLIYAGSVSVLGQALMAAQRFNKPIICWCWDIPYNWRDWDMDEEGMKKNAVRDNNNSRNVAMLRQCDMVISGSKWTQSVLKEQYGISSEQIYFYIETVSINTVPPQLKEKQIMQVSRYFYNKKFEHTIKASRGLVDYKVVFVGANLNSGYGRTLQVCADTYNKNVEFNNILNRYDVIEHMKKSTVVVSPSVFEGWGMSPMEALFCDTPVLLSDLDVFQEVYGDSVLYHKRNHVDDMKEKLECLVGDKDLQAKIVRDCKPIIAEFTQDKFIERWKRLIER